MTAEKYSAEWFRELAAADRELAKYELVDEVLRDIFEASSEVEWRDGFREGSAARAKFEHYRDVVGSVWEDRTAAWDRRTEVEFGREYREQQQQQREERRRERAAGRERSR